MSRFGEWTPVTLEERLDRIESINEIRQLVSRYTVALDSRNMDALVALFAPDVQVGPEATGRAALRRWFTEAMSHMRTTIHFVGNHVIEFVDANRATGIVYCHDQLDRPDFQTWDDGYLQYWDTYVRVGGEWLFARRKFHRWFIVDALSRPEHGAGVNTGHDPLFAHQLPEAYPSWSAYWTEVGAGGLQLPPQYSKIRGSTEVSLVFDPHHAQLRRCGVEAPFHARTTDESDGGCSAGRVRQWRGHESSLPRSRLPRRLPYGPRWASWNMP